MSRSTLIAGCGYVGSELARLLVRAGEQVWGMTPSTAELPAGVHPLIADLRDPATLNALPPVDQVVFAAAPSAHDEASYRATYVDGLRNLVAATSGGASPATRLLFCSSMGVYGQSDGSLVDEASATEPARFSGHVMIEAEQVALSGPVPAIVARIAGIYGAQRQRVVGRVRRGEVKIAPGASTHSNLIHRDDCAAALRHLLGLETPAPLYVLVDDQPVEQAVLLRGIAELLGVSEPEVGVDENISPWMRQRPGDRGKRLSNRLLRDSGFVCRYPSFREGYAAIIAGGER